MFVHSELTVNKYNYHFNKILVNAETFIRSKKMLSKHVVIFLRAQLIM